MTTRREYHPVQGAYVDKSAPPDPFIEALHAQLKASLRPQVWTARYTVTARDGELAREYIREQALRDVPDATVEFIRGPIRDKGARSYWRATVKRERS